jgi:Mn-dependent DtxR family transcriptional regulator
MHFVKSQGIYLGQYLDSYKQNSISLSYQNRIKIVSYRIILTKKAIKSSTIANKLNIPNPTVKRILNEQISKNLIEKHGIGPVTYYTIK